MMYNVENKRDMTVGEMIDWLGQFGRDVPLLVWLNAEDRLELMGLYAEDPGEPGYPKYPMIVVDW